MSTLTRAHTFICSLAASNVSFANITRLREHAYTQYYRRQLMYLSDAKEARATAVAARGGSSQHTLDNLAGSTTADRQPPPFVDKARLYSISAPYVIDVFLSSTQEYREYMALWLAGIGGEIIKVDHLFKACKRIRDSAGQPQFAAVLTS